MWESINSFDKYLFDLINQGGRNALFDILMPIVSNSLYFVIPAVVLWVMLILKKDVKKRVAAVMILLAIVTSDMMSARVLKPLFHRPRPYHALSGVHYYRGGEWRVTSAKMAVSTSTNFSMPSSHATNMFAGAVFLSWLFPGFAWLFFLLAMLVSYSRPYLGMHYPMDLAAGAVFGAMIGIFYIFLMEWILRWNKNNKNRQLQ